MSEVGVRAKERERGGRKARLTLGYRLHEMTHQWRKEELSQINQPMEKNNERIRKEPGKSRVVPDDLW